MTWQVHTVLAAVAAFIAAALKIRPRGQHRADPLHVSTLDVRHEVWPPAPPPPWPPAWEPAAVTPTSAAPPWELAHVAPLSDADLEELLRGALVLVDEIDVAASLPPELADWQQRQDEDVAMFLAGL